MDSARFRQLVARETQEPVESVTGMVLGEHGENAVPIWSSVTIMGGKSSDQLKGLIHDTYAKVPKYFHFMFDIYFHILFNFFDL